MRTLEDRYEFRCRKNIPRLFRSKRCSMRLIPSNRPELRHKWRIQKSLLQNLRTLSLSAAVCANIVFATPHFRFSGLEPPTSRFFLSNTGCFFIPTLASPRFVLLQRCRPPNTHSPFVQLAAMNNDNHNNQSIDNINDFHVPAVIAFPIDKCVRCRQQNQTPSSQQLRGDLCCACCLLVLLEFCVGVKTTDPSSLSSR